MLNDSDGVAFFKQDWGHSEHEPLPWLERYMSQATEPASRLSMYTDIIPRTESARLKKLTCLSGTPFSRLPHGL